MARIAGGGSNDVIGAFTCSHSAVMAVRAQIRRLAVIYGQCKRAPSWTRSMTGVAVVTGNGMSRTLSSGNVTVVTTTALLRRLSMVERHNDRRPHIGGMASVTQITGQWMIGRLEGTGTDAIVASRTGAGLPGNSGVIEHSH